jgi:hypothetical protein
MVHENGYRNLTRNIKIRENNFFSENARKLYIHPFQIFVHGKEYTSFPMQRGTNMNCEYNTVYSKS